MFIWISSGLKIVPLTKNKPSVTNLASVPNDQELRKFSLLADFVVLDGSEMGMLDHRGPRH